MFDDTGKNVQLVGKIIGILLALGGIIWGFKLFSSSNSDIEILGWIPLVSGPIAGYVTALFINAFGLITEASEKYLHDASRRGSMFNNHYSPLASTNNSGNRCHACGAANMPQAKFCTTCGANLNNNNSSTHFTHTIACSYCGKMTPVSSPKCMYCGSSMLPESAAGDTSEE